jgi:hypothetical protein
MASRIAVISAMTCLLCPLAGAMQWTGLLCVL